MVQPVWSFQSSFWPSFWIIWRWGTFFGTALSLVLTSAVGLVFGWEVHLLLALAGSLGSGLGVGLALALVVAYYRVYVTVDGISGYDVFGLHHFAAWPSIEEVRPINLLGLRYLRVWSSATPRPLWVPLFLADMPGFCVAIVDCAGPDHPLAQALGSYRP